MQALAARGEPILSAFETAPEDFAAYWGSHGWSVAEQLDARSAHVMQATSDWARSLIQSSSCMHEAQSGVIMSCIATQRRPCMDHSQCCRKADRGAPKADEMPCGEGCKPCPITRDLDTCYISWWKS